MNSFGDFKVRSNQNYIYHSYRKYHPFLCIYDAAILYPDKTYRHTRNPSYAGHLFEYIVSGKGYIDCDGRRYTVSAGDCIYISKSCSVTYFADSEEPYTKLWFSADGALPEKLCEALGFTGELFICKRDLYGEFQRIFHILENDGFELERMSKHLVGIMLALFGNSSESPTEDMSLPCQIKAYIDTVITSAPTVDGIASHFGISSATVIRRFKGEYGETPNEYIKRGRMQMAEAMLRNTDYSVSRIAHLLCFCSQSYFSEAFKSFFGVYPTQYRQMRK